MAEIAFRNVRIDRLSYCEGGRLGTTDTVPETLERSRNGGYKPVRYFSYISKILE